MKRTNVAWNLFGLTVTFILAVLGLSPQYAWLAPWIMGAAAVCGATSVASLLWPVIGKRIDVSGPFLVMALAVVTFLCGLAWQTWPKADIESENKEDNLSAQERMRRKFLLEDATQSFLNSHPNADPLIFAGLASAPQASINEYLKRAGENWTFTAPNIAPATEGSIYVSCNVVNLPIKMRDGQAYHTINAIPLPLASRGGAGWNTYVAPKDTEVNFGLKVPMVMKCEITSYAKTPIVDLTMALSMVWQHVVEDASNPNAQRGGAIHLARPWHFGISKIDPGAENKIIFYIPNYSNFFRSFEFPGESCRKVYR